jgi:hypothetical protein
MALAIAGATSAGGLAALAVKSLRAKAGANDRTPETSTGRDER